MHNWSGYTIKRGIKSEEFKKYLRARGIYFEPSSDGEYIHFEVLNSDEYVDSYVKKLVLNDSKYNLKDMDAEQIISLIKEAGEKGRSWEWLKNKLPESFLNLWKNEKTGASRYVFPIAEDWTNKTPDERGVYLNKPKKLSSTVDWTLIDDFNEIKTKTDALLDKYGVTNYDDLYEAIKKAYDEEDSISKRKIIEQDKENRRKYMEDVEKLFYKKGLGSYSYYSTIVEMLNRDYVISKKELSEKLDNSYKGRKFIEGQRQHLIKDPNGKIITSLSNKVGKLTPGAEEYIRKILKGTDTEEIESKKSERAERGREGLGWDWKKKQPYSYKNDILNKWHEDLYSLKELLNQYKHLLERGTFSKLGFKPEHDELKYVGESGHYDYRGNFKRGGGYTYTNKRIPGAVTGPVEFKEFTDVLSKAFRATTVADLKQAIEESLEVVKKLPDDSVKLKKAKQDIEYFLNNKRIEMQERSAKRIKKLPDASYKTYVYLFPKLTKRDISKLNYFDLVYLEKTNLPGKDDKWAVEGTKKNLLKYCTDYLDYELVKEYLYTKEDYEYLKENNRDFKDNKNSYYCWGFTIEVTKDEDGEDIFNVYDKDGLFKYSTDDKKQAEHWCYLWREGNMIPGRK